jgi:glycosyltransferase involved in cell wall biosynthesis
MIPRVLLVSEFSQLATGYSVYSRNLLKGLAESNKYAVAEMASYCDRPYDLPWKVYPVLPRNEEEKRVYDSHPHNVFGRHVLESVCLDFRPTHVISFRDNWMDRFIVDSPYRKSFNFIWMPTVDSVQQDAQWYADYLEADALLSYTDFSVDTLRDEAALYSHGEAPMPCSEYFVPMDKDDVKRSFGINPEMKIVGFVGRNQKRKLFPELFEAFRAFLNKSERQDIVLWIHTAYPDINGWNFPRLIQQYDLGQKVILTYTDGNTVKPMPFSGAFQFNGGWNMRTSSVVGHVPDYEMARIYNAFDYYVQYITNEGFGAPVLEAAACGVHGCATNYSATEDTTKKLGWDKLDYQLIEEIETGRLIAVPNKEDLIKKLEDFFLLPKTYRNLKGLQARQNYVKHYSWTKTCEKWMSVIDSLPPKGYIPLDIQRPEPFKEFGPTGQFVKWLILRVLCQPNKLGTLWEANLIKDINLNLLDPNQFKTTKKSAYDMCLNMRNHINHWENIRQNKF